MTATTQDRNTPNKNVTKRRAYPVAADEVIPAGVGVGVLSGYAVNAQDAAGVKTVGVSIEAVDNTGGADGDKYVVVHADGDHEFASSGLAQTDLGKKAYWADNQTVLPSAGLASGSNAILAGEFAEILTATRAVLDIDDAVKTGS
jgi:hypothetical protein